MSDLKPSTGSDQTTPDPSTVRIPRAVRTAAATAGRMRASEERGAARLRERGWVCIPPDHPAVTSMRIGDFLDDCIETK